MSYSLDDIEGLLTKAIAEEPAGHNSQARGEACSYLALSALKSIGVEADTKEGARLGPAIVTVALCAFDLGVLAERELVAKR